MGCSTLASSALGSDQLSQIDSAKLFEIHTLKVGRHMVAVIGGAATMRPERQAIGALFVATYRLMVCVLFHRRHYRHHMVGLLDCEVECGKCGRTWMVN